MQQKGRVLVYGMIGRQPFAGVVWQVLHYLVGFKRLGYDVYYVDDTHDWPYDGDTQSLTDDCTFTTRLLTRLMEWAGLEGRWVYRFAGAGPIYGMTQSRYEELLASADALVNVTASTWLFEEHLRIPVRVYIETDPVLPQIEVAQGNQTRLDELGNHTHHFSYGENFGAPDCGVPIERFTYHPTRQPVVIDWWEGAPAPAPPGGRRRFTTIASWKQSGKDLVWRGESYRWSKHWEFLKFIDLPARTDQRFELALAAIDEADRSMLHSHGWQTSQALAISADVFTYRDFIRGSDAEFTPAKDQNIRLRSGWFSDRSATYLAAGKPVITQDTAFGNILPTGLGLHSFLTMDDILAAIDRIKGDYDRESRAASQIAREYFAAEKVVGDIARKAGFGQ